MRGTRVRSGLWKWLTNQVDPEYVVPQIIQPIVDATKNYPLEYRFANLQGTQAAAGPADLNIQLGPPQGKAWWVDQVSFFYNQVRAGSVIQIKLEELSPGGVVIAGVGMLSVPQASVTLSADTPLTAYGASGSYGYFPPAGVYLRGSDPGVAQTGISTATRENFRFNMTNTMLNDSAVLRCRYLEFDLAQPPGS